MTKLAERLNRLSPSATLAMSQKSNELKAQGIDASKEFAKKLNDLLNVKGD